MAAGQKQDLVDFTEQRTFFGVWELRQVAMGCRSLWLMLSVQTPRLANGHAVLEFIPCCVYALWVNLKKHWFFSTYI